MHLTKRHYNRRWYLFRSYGDGWDVFWFDKSLIVVEEGCSTLQEAINCAKNHAYGA